MKKSVFLFSFLMLGITLSATAQNLKVDARSTSVAWKATKVSGGHNGTVGIKSGDIQMDGNKLKSAKIVLDMTNIVCLDIKDKETNGKLVGHLHSDDFFSTAKNPTVTFDLSKATETRGEAGANYTITGKLTIKGITQDVTFPSTVTYMNGQMKATGTMKFDRTKYEIKYNSGTFFSGLGDYMINDEVEVGFNLVTAAN